MPISSFSFSSSDQTQNQEPVCAPLVRNLEFGQVARCVASEFKRNMSLNAVVRIGKNVSDESEELSADWKRRDTVGKLALLGAGLATVVAATAQIRTGRLPSVPAASAVAKATDKITPILSRLVPDGVERQQPFAGFQVPHDLRIDFSFLRLSLVEHALKAPDNLASRIALRESVARLRILGERTFSGKTGQFHLTNPKSAAFPPGTVVPKASYEVQTRKFMQFFNDLRGKIESIYPDR